MSLLSAAIGIWGWQTGLWFFAIPMILIFEGRRYVQAHWSFSLRDLKNLLKLCSGMVGLLLLFLLITQPSFGLIYSLLQWLPVCAFPLIAANAYSNNSLSALLCLHFSPPYFLQKGFSGKQNPINFYIPYIALCLLSASATNAHGVEFYVMTVALVAMLLRNYRPQRSNPILWVCLILLVSGMGFVGHLQLHQLQAKLEQQTAPWLSGLSGESVDPYQANTRIGSIGDLKQSNAIVFRVATSDHQALPLLLREATYNKYQSSAWVAVKSRFTPVQPTQKGTIWNFGADSEPSSSITISASLERGKGLLRLPDGASSVDQLPVEKMKKNQYGAVKVEGKLDAITYRIRFDSTRTFDSLPTEEDLQIPNAEQPIIAQTLQQLSLVKKSPLQTLKQVSSFFEQNFQYSLTLSRADHSVTPLTAFLAKNHSGHCEYFATATTLLLRAAGIPARYATGYSVHEFSSLEHQYIVRSRDAHAWTMAYINGTWQAFDTTPPNWIAQEEAETSPLQWFADLWSFLSFKLSTALQAFAKGDGFSRGWWVVIPLFLFSLWNLSRRIRRLRVRRTHKPVLTLNDVVETTKSGLDSEFYTIEQALTEIGLHRLSSESLKHWMKRLEAHLQKSLFENLTNIIELHYRYRFDPQQMQISERVKLKSLSQTWLHNFRQSLISK